MLGTSEDEKRDCYKTMDLPDRITDVTQLEYCLSHPTAAAVASMKRLSGDLILLGVAGKMGPSLAMMARRASGAGGCIATHHWRQSLLATCDARNT